MGTLVASNFCLPQVTVIVPGQGQTLKREMVVEAIGRNGMFFSIFSRGGGALVQVPLCK